MILNSKHSKCPRRGLKLCIFSALTVVMMVLTSNAYAAGVVIAQSHFDGGQDDFDGWVAISCPNDEVCANPAGEFDFVDGVDKFVHLTTGGDGNSGHIRSEDPDSDNAARLKAPSKFSDNLALGQTLSLWTIITDPSDTGSPDVPVAPLVYIQGAGKTLVYGVPVPAEDVGVSHIVPIEDTPGDTNTFLGWFTITGTTLNTLGALNPGDFGAVLADPNKQLSIIGEWLNDSPDEDRGGLDSVVLSAPVPVPAALPLMLSALAGFGFAARRKKTK